MEFNGYQRKWGFPHLQGVELAWPCSLLLDLVLRWCGCSQRNSSFREGSKMLSGVFLWTVPLATEKLTVAFRTLRDQ